MMSIAVNSSATGNTEDQERESLIVDVCSPATSNTKKRKSLVVDIDAGGSPTSPQKPTKSVHFSKMNHVRLYERSSKTSAREMFYSDVEYDAMRKARKQLVIDVHGRVLLTARGHYNASECFEGVMLTGIEKFLTQDILDKSLRCRIACLRAVLQEQARQREADECNTCELAEVSQIRSRWAVKRAERIASWQSNPYPSIN